MNDTEQVLAIFEAAGATVSPSGYTIGSESLHPFDVTLKVTLRGISYPHAWDARGLLLELVAADGTVIELYPDQIRLPKQDGAE